MNKKLMLLLLIVTLTGCEKPINITAPTILIQNETIYVAEQLKISVEEYADIDGSRIKADYYKWSIENSQGTVIKEDFKDSSSVYWMPENNGYFIIKVKIGYDDNKSITTLKEVNVFENEGSLSKKITGHWKGTGTRRQGNGEWGVDLYIDSTGHYYGTADFYSFNPYCEKGVFNCERLDFYLNGQLDSCGIPGDVPGQRLELFEVINNKGFGVVWIGWTSYNYGEFPVYECIDLYDIEDLQLSLDGKELYFEFNNRGSNDYYEWERKFDLKKQ